MTTLAPFPAGRPLDVAIIGAGLCGLTLARSLVAQGFNVQVLEARSRIGGRVLTQRCNATGQALDLGPTWFWPDTEPRITSLLAELGLSTLAQHDPGDCLWLTDPNRAAERRRAPGGVHAGARRIQGGAAQLVQALAAQLPSDCVQTDTAVSMLRDRGEFIAITTTGPTLLARRVVLALPPRLVSEHIQFVPALEESVKQALEDSPTWMAAQAKTVSTFAHAFWRSQGQSGNAFVRHPQAVLAEVFDCCPAEVMADAHVASPTAGALGGFVALNATQRDNFRRGLPLLIESQLTQLFGVDAQEGTLFLQDWATEPFTCSTSDRSKPPEPPQSNPLLRQSLWKGRIFWGSSETAAHGTGHMEGALEAADRIVHALARAQAQPIAQPIAHVSSVPLSVTPCVNAAVEPATRATAMAVFSANVMKLRSKAAQRYEQHLTRLLVTQQTDMLTQRALLATVDQCYSEALAQLDPLLGHLDAVNAEVAHGRHALTAELLAAFEGWNKALLEAALGFNRASCALSNFAQDHQPNGNTLRAITLDLAAAWREFAIELNTRLLAATQSTPQL